MKTIAERRDEAQELRGRINREHRTLRNKIRKLVLRYEELNRLFMPRSANFEWPTPPPSAERIEQQEISRALKPLLEDSRKQGISKRWRDRYSVLLTPNVDLHKINI